MNDYIRKNNAIYFESIKTYPNDHRGVKWFSRESQFLRFKVLCEINKDLMSGRVLDVGCGLGHLVDYLQSNDFKGTYKGIDLVEQMVVGAQKRHPTYDFVASDIDTMKESFDYVLASGIFTFVDWEKMQEIILKLMRCAKKGVAFNSLSTRAPKKEADVFYADPTAVLAFCKKIAPRARIRQDYMQHDFTIYLYLE